MKKIIILSTLLSLSVGNAFADEPNANLGGLLDNPTQTPSNTNEPRPPKPKEDPNKIYDPETENIECDAEFPGGDIQAWLLSNLRYPKHLISQNINGRVIVEFVIEKDGTTSEHKIVKGLHDDIDDEAIRLVKMMVWEPAYHKNKEVRVRHLLPINFKAPKKQSSTARLYAKAFQAYQRGEYDDAKIMFEEGAAQDDPNCLNGLATMYFNGDGVDRDHERAVSYYERAADGGHKYAALTLAQCYFYGDGVRQDQSRAVEIYQQLEYEDDSAAYNLAQCYEGGIGTRKDIDAAREIYNRLIDNNSTLSGQARDRLTDLSQDGSGLNGIIF